MLSVTHNAGFFSCCSIRLQRLIEYINQNKKIPEILDTSKQFAEYKNNTNRNQDTTFDYFEHYNNINVILNFDKRIDYNSECQFEDFNKLDFLSLTPIVQKFFSPSKKILQICEDLINKYNIDLDDLYTIYFRGTDKKSETTTPDFDMFIHESVNYYDGEQKILIQTDEPEFERKCKYVFGENAIIIKELEPRHKNNYPHSLFLLAIVYLISQSKRIITTSGNVSSFFTLQRGNTKNIKQFLNNKWFC